MLTAALHVGNGAEPPSSDPEVLCEASRLVLGATTTRARALVGYTLVLGLEALAHPDLATPIAAVLAVLEGAADTDAVVIGALTVAGNAALHRGLKAGTIKHKVGDDTFTCEPEAFALVCAWLVFRAVAAMLGEPGPDGRRKAGELLKDAFALVKDLPEATRKMSDFFRTVDLGDLADEDALEQGSTG